MEGRKTRDKPCGLAHTDRDFWIYVGDTDFSAYVKGRKDRGREGRRKEERKEGRKKREGKNKEGAIKWPGWLKWGTR